MPAPPPPAPIKFPGTKKSSKKISEGEETKATIPTTAVPSTPSVSFKLDTTTESPSSEPHNNNNNNNSAGKTDQQTRKENIENEKYFFDLLAEVPSKQLAAINVAKSANPHQLTIPQTRQGDRHQLSPVTINSYQSALKEKDEKVKLLSQAVEELTRENNALQQHIAELINCGLTADTSSYSNYTSTYPSSRALLAAAVGNNTIMEEEVRRREIETSEVKFLQARVKRLEVALQLEMESRESLEERCAAQQKMLVQRFAVRGFR
eukprot:Tbor_TRINITY_DN5625_c4_g1::TRINITY_DN5625_c4_g1_i1::g.8132::m.8132